MCVGGGGFVCGGVWRGCGVCACTSLHFMAVSNSQKHASQRPLVICPSYIHILVAKVSPHKVESVPTPLQRMEELQTATSPLLGEYYY